MIIVQLLGGLGNQMFQYAAGKRLATEKGTKFKLDISSYKSETLRAYKLHHFKITADIATQEECDYFIATNIQGKIRRLLERQLLPRSRRHIYYEKTPYQFESAILHTPKQVYLKGYFQNENYFKSVESIIRNDFNIITPSNEVNRAIAERIRNVEAVSVHIRRGDYATNPQTRVVHGLLPLQYYKNAIEKIAQEVDKPHFFIFSDDPDWAKEHLQLTFPTIWINHNDAQHDYEDLQLMSLCQHHIIANSSFSWWGAWLSSNLNKKVYAPERWLLDNSIDFTDVVPHQWIRLPVEN